MFHVQPEDDHYPAPKHVIVPYVENTLYSTNKYSCLFLNINQLDALNFTIRLFQASTCFEHMTIPETV